MKFHFIKNDLFGDNIVNTVLITCAIVLFVVGFTIVIVVNRK